MEVTVSYRVQLASLLSGCSRYVVMAFMLSVLSVLMDIICMSALPIFVAAALSSAGSDTVSLPWLGDWLPALSLQMLTFTVVGLFLFRAGFMLLLGSGMATLTERIRESVVKRIFDRFLYCSYEESTAQSSSLAITAATSYANSFAQNVVLPLLRLLVDLLTILAVLAFVYMVEPAIVVVTGMVLCTVAAAYYLGIRRISDHQSRKLAEYQVQLTRQVTQALSAPREIRIFGLQLHFSQQSHVLLRSIAKAQAWMGAIYWFPRALGELTLIALAIAYMLLKASYGFDFVTVASNLSVLAFAGLRLLPAFAQSMVNISQLRAGRTIVARLVDMIEPDTIGVVRSSKGEGDENQTNTSILQSLVLKSIGFSYSQAATPVLQEVNLHIERGESIGVMGPSGAGKSTLADLMLGLLEPEQGEIQLNGKNLIHRPQVLWAMVGFVPQSPFIDNDTLLRNVAFGVSDSEVDHDRVRTSLEMACLSEVVAQLPQGVDTYLGDSGVRLSGGQRQRVAIARALYRQRSLLVLDEATSALDAESEAEVIKAIESLKGKVTTVIIAHRISTLANCDRIYEVRAGRVKEVPKSQLLTNPEQ